MKLVVLSLALCLASGSRKKRFLDEQWWDQFHSGVDRLEMEGRKDFQHLGQWADRVEEQMRPSIDDFAKTVGRQYQQMAPTLNNWAERRVQQMGPVLNNWAESMGDRIGSMGDRVAPAIDSIDRRVGGLVHSIMDSLGDSPLFEQGMVDRNDGSPVVTGEASIMPVEIESNLNIPSGRPGIFNNFDQLLGSGLHGLSGSLDGLSSLDPFSMFGSSRRSWWRGQNVCTERDVIEEGDEKELNNDNHGFGVFQMNMQMTQCRDDENVHECSTTMTENGVKKTVRVIYTCCHGHRKEGNSCLRVDMKSLADTIEDLGGDEFLTMLAENDLMDKLNENLTMFVPTDDAIADFNEELTQRNIIAGADGSDDGGVVYNIDDGLMARRKKRELAITDITEAPRMQDMLLAHMTAGFVDTASMRDESSLITETSDQSSMRLTVYNTYPKKVVMANCARIVSRDNLATNGIVHMVDKVVVPSTATVAEVLSQDVHFRSFYAALESSGLADALSEEGQFTVFAPTEEAFNKLDAKTRNKIMSGNGCAQDILKNHLLPNVVCSGIIESKAKTNNLLGKYIVLNRNDDGEVMVEGKKIIIRDIMGTNGVIHVIEDVIVPESARNVPEALKEKKLDAFVELFEAADLIEEMEAMANMTIFAPSKKALSELPADYVTNLKNDKSALKEFLMYHVTGPKLCKCDLKNNLELQSGLDGKKIRVNNYGSNLLFGDRSKVQTAQCSKLVDMDNEVCGGFIHVVDKVLLPPAGNIHTILKDAKSYSKFLDLVAFAEMENELTGDVAHTVLVPTNDAFKKLEDDVATRMFEEKEIAEKVIKNHIVKEMICCAGIQRNVFIFNQSRKRLASGEIVNMRRSDTGHIFVNKAPVNTCDMVGDNGVAHSVDEVLLPRELKPVVEQQQSQRRRTVIKNILDPFNLF